MRFAALPALGRLTLRRLFERLGPANHAVCIVRILAAAIGEDGKDGIDAGSGVIAQAKDILLDLWAIDGGHFHVGVIHAVVIRLNRLNVAGDNGRVGQGEQPSRGWQSVP